MRCLVYVFVFFLPFLGFGQIVKPGAKKQQVKPPVDKPQIYEVQVHWQGPGVGVVFLDEHKLIIEEGSSKCFFLEEKLRTLRVEKPGKNYYAADYLLIKPEKSVLILGISGEKLSYKYMSVNEAELYEKAMEENRRLAIQAEREIENQKQFDALGLAKAEEYRAKGDEYYDAK